MVTTIKVGTKNVDKGRVYSCTVCESELRFYLSDVKRIIAERYVTCPICGSDIAFANVWKPETA